MYFPSREIVQTPDEVGLSSREVWPQTEDGQRLHSWWITGRTPTIGHVLLCHGNAGNIGDRLLHAKLLSDVGFDVLLFDYRGYGLSSGSPQEEGLYRDARAALAAALAQPELDPDRMLYLGESLGGAVALRLALEAPPRGLVLQSTFSSVRDIARVHYRFIPTALVPDAFPSLRRIGALLAPLLVLHGDRDDVVPLSQGQALFEAAPSPKQIHVFPGAGHSDLVVVAEREYGHVIARWVGTAD
jgi:fermentation-respiration switch protein FrsA (DUF1100 family)